MIKAVKKYLLIGFFLLGIFYSCKVYRKSDYALLSQKNNWLHDFALGSPSWDNFERFKNNPVYRGRKGMEWPVNGFLFADPVSNNWYLYIGEYKTNYNTVQQGNSPNFNCVILRSTDKGKKWKKIGDLFPGDIPSYGQVKIQVPDVMLTFADGRYHMVFDWLPEHFDWQHTASSGLGYAVADSPEGPFVVSSHPIKLNTQYDHKPLLARYSRMYAPMIVKRKKDWALIYMMDTSPARSWALAVSTASKPDGPYSDAELVMNVEQKTNFQPLQEFFPAFTHGKYVYLPATSVAINRNYQSVYRVKTEDLTNTSTYKLISAGDLWHAQNTENEYAGIWGQTFSGFVDKKDSLYVMFPSKDQQNYGTINIAKASWNDLYRHSGFNFAANEGDAFTYIKKIVDLKNVETEFDLQGTMHLIWDVDMPIDLLNGWGKFDLHQSDATYKEVVVSNKTVNINEYDRGRRITIGNFKITAPTKEGANKLKLSRSNNEYSIIMNDSTYWKGALKSKPGLVGILLEPHSYLYANSFVMEGRKMKGYITYGYYNAILAAGDQDKDWTLKTDTMFLYGKGGVSKRDSAFAKWNYDGKGFQLFSPRGPLYGTVNIYLDGKKMRTIDLKSEKDVRSSLIFGSGSIAQGAHAIYIESTDGLLPVDCIKVTL